ncbi:MAG: elongation factor P [Planctomycetes bacterium]|nr:elongation factor P [Planctomycetota bacterium]
MIKAAELRKGRMVLHEGVLYSVHDAQHVAKGNKRSYMQTKLKNFKTGAITDIRFSVDDRFEVPFVESKEFEFLYREGDGFVLMDTETYDQVTIGQDLFGEAVKFLKVNERISCQIYEEAIIAVELPNVVTLEVTDTPPVVKGATATNQPKDATLETGARVRVPSFIAPGEAIRVDTRNGEYVERAK